MPSTIRSTEQKGKLHILRNNQNVALQSTLPDRLAIASHDGIRLLAIADITFIQSEGNYARLHTLTGHCHLISKTLKQIQSGLLSHGFFRAHQSFLVNSAHIKHISNGKERHILLVDDSSIPVSRRYYSFVKNHLLTQYSI